MDKISEGAESSIYSVNFMGLDGILKRRMSKPYRIREIDESIRTRRTRKEARIMGIVSSLGINSPTVLLADRYDILMSRIRGSSMNRILESNTGKIPRSVFSEIGRGIAVLHNNNITHGDYTPANIMIDKKQNAHIIDFGLSDISLSAEDKAMDILLMKRSIDEAHFGVFIKSYKAACKESASILKRLEDIEKRGRYNTRTLLTV
ncbi:MAG: Kae1-associated serine/threonine protein kinase [Candidatus Micrarchaeota archaeon]|nr:Kae1-associated serine/threonine protein kinase [Candidatus Micrarchaeota archaeon]